MADRRRRHSKAAKKRRARKVVKARKVEVVTAILHCKGGPMRDRRLRRVKEKERRIPDEG